ncbi:hypothetical protein BGZ82_011355 [Podila clonocystis]|nr:hypothetical protein BGZ82_011355 [Podila clonocystis]
MSAKLVPPATSPSMANLASKVISRLASHHMADDESESDITTTTSITSQSHINNNQDDDDDDEDAGIIRCICNYTDDDGFTIQCEHCLVWQHAVCVGIVQSNVPDRYLCEQCSPRPVDRKRANEVQRKRIGALDRKREKTPPPPSRRKATSATSSSSSKQASNKESSSHATLANSSTSVQSGKGSLSNTDARKGKGANKTPSSHTLSSHQQGHPSLPSATTTLSSPQTTPSSTKQKGGSQPNNYRSSSAARAEDEDIEMESDNSQEDLLDSYQFEFSSVEMNIVTSKAVQDLFRMVISQFRQAQSRKRSLSITSGVKLQELVASASANDTPTSIPESPDLSSTTLGTLPPPPIVDTTNLVSMERESLARPLMKATVKHILSSSKTHHSPAPQYGLFAESSIGAGRFMMEFKGEVSLKSTYKSDPINQYSILATPKPFVLFHPHLDLVVDARRSGNDARFVRRSCFPNTEVKSIVVPGVQDQTVHLGLFAKVPIGKGQEITLDWDWKRDHPALQPLKPDKSKDSNRKSSKEIRKAKFMVASTLLAQTDCACDNKDACVLHQMMKDGMSEPSPRDNDASTKGNRPKKTVSESLRQRYGNHRDRSVDNESGKRSAEQESSNEEELSVTETSPRRKSPKAIKLESSSKKARHREGHGHYRAEQEQGSESDSDDHRRRKPAVSERSEASLSRTNQGLSSREMKQAMIQINKLEDKDSSKPKAQGSTAKGSALPSPSKDSVPFSRRSGVTSPTPRRDKNPSVDSDIRSNSPSKKLVMTEEDNISIGDSGIDSDSNNGQSGRDTFNTALSGNKRLFSIQSQGKRYRDPVENDTMSQSSVASDSDRRDDNPRPFKGSSPSRSGKRPYSAASRGKRIAETLSPKHSLSFKDKSGKQESGLERHVSGSSSMESSFVSIVGNTSDEEEEYSQKSDRQALREKNLPKETLPAASLKPSMLPCKKVWKMIYMKQRALAEEEALEKAEEMRKKAEEVFDLKMEEEDPTNVQPPRNSVESAPKDEVSEAFVPKVKSEPESDVTDQPTIVHEDILNLFHEDVRPEPSEPQPGKDAKNIQMASPPLSGSSKPTIVEQSVIAARTVVSDISIVSAQVEVTDAKNVSEVNEVIEAKDAKDVNPPQKMSLESYQARRKASRSPALAETTDTPVPSEPAAVSIEPRKKDVEMIEVQSETINAVVLVPGNSIEPEVETVVETSSTEAPPVVEAIPVPKVKLSLQEYQKQRQVASQRVVNPGSELPPAKNKVNDTDVTEASSVLESSVQNRGSSATASDVEMKDVDSIDDIVGDMPLAEVSAVPNEPTRGDYFDVGNSLPTPLIGLSSRAQAGVPGDYFPVQPFSPISLSAGATPFSKLNLTSSPPHTTSDAPARSPAKSPVRSHVSSSPKDQDVRSGRPGLGSSPSPSTQGSAGWRTPRSQRGTSPQPGGQGPSPGSYRNGEPRPAEIRSNDGRLTSPRYHGSPSSDRAPPNGGPLGSPTRERQHSLTSGVLPTFPYEVTGGGHYGYDDPSFKRSGPMSSPTGPALGPRDYYKGDERARHRSMNGDEWGYSNVDQAGYGGYRGLRGAPPPPPRDRERDRDREHDRDRERDRRDRYDRRDYFMNGSMSGGGNTGGGNIPGYYGPNRGASTGGPGPGGPGLYGRRPSDYYNQGGRDEGFNKNTGNGNTAFDGGNNSNNAGVP